MHSLGEEANFSLWLLPKASETYSKSETNLARNFDLKVECPEIIFSHVIEVDERVLMDNEKCCLDELGNLPRARGTIGEEIIIEREPNLDIHDPHEKNCSILTLM